MRYFYKYIIEKIIQFCVVSNQICDEEREALAKQCIISSNGSANALVKEIMSSHVLCGEEFPNDLELKSHRFKNVVRKCVSEYMNEDMVS